MTFVLCLLSAIPQSLQYAWELRSFLCKPYFVVERMARSSACSRHGIRLCIKVLISGESLFVRLWTMSFMNISISIGPSVLPCCTPVHGVISGHIPFRA